MRRCIVLAGKGSGYVSPNPLVGAVIVHQDRIIGEGFHREYGAAHAEVNAVSSVTEADVPVLSESTLYVSLEPCSHFGKTPPCTDLIIKKKIPRVVIGCADSFEKVNGSGIEKLRAAGVDVQVNVLRHECRALNKRFFTFHEKQRPYIILKWAESADGMIAGVTGQRIKISNEHTDRLVHRWRAEEAGILAGTNTIMNDDPFLTVRHIPGRNPVRIIIDSDLKINGDAHVFDRAAQTIIINKTKEEISGNIEFFKIGEDEDLLHAVTRGMQERGLNSLLVEGGAKTLQSFIDAGIWDEARVITHTAFRIGKGTGAPVLKNAEQVRSEIISSDRINLFRKKNNEFLSYH